MAIHIVLLAGGTGSRMGANRPKQFLTLKGRPILAHSAATFLAWPGVGRLCVVSLGEALERSRSIIEEIHASLSEASPPVLYCAGGATRHASCIAGINRIRGEAVADDLVFIHDAARPLITREELDRLAAAFDDRDVAVASLASRVTDTIVAAPALPGTVTEKLDRDRLFAVKTPQAVRVSALDRLMAIPERPDFTDLLTWGTAAGVPGKLVEASPLNIKVTTDRDLRLLEHA